MILDQVESLINADRQGEAMDLLNPYLVDNPDDGRALYYLGNVLLEAGKPTLAECVYAKANTVTPGRWMILTNMARCYADQHRYDKALTLWLQVDEHYPGNPIVQNSIASALLQLGEPLKAIEWCNKALYSEPDNVKAHANLGFAYILLGDYARGWDEYAWGQGFLEWRDLKQYAGEPEWDGQEGDVIVYGEQGVGDQILFSNPIHDLCQRQNTRVVFECHKKLEGLFRRSYPQAEVHGTQLRDINSLEWVGDRTFAGSISLSGLQRHFRRQSDDWNGEPFIEACPVRSEQWAATFTRPGKNIGIAWSGGLVKTRRSMRSTDLETLLLIFQAQPNANWISLQYQPCSEEIEAFRIKHGIKIENYPWATQTTDYDDAAALVANLDVIVAPTTAAIHLGGALGVETHCIVNPAPHCYYQISGDRLPYYNSVRMYRRAGKDWSECVDRVAEAIR